MKKSLIIIMVIAVSIGMKAQEIKEQIILVNQKNNVHLFFDSPIKSGVVGSDHFIFAYNTEQKEKIGILKGSLGESSNLLVITDDGSIFSFILQYSKDVTKFNYFFNSKDAIGNINKAENEESYVTNNSKTNDPVYENRYDSVRINKEIKESFESDFIKNSKEVINQGKFYKRFYSINNGIRLKLNNLIYKENHFYFYLEIENETKIDYDLNFMDFYISTKNKKIRNSSQKIVFKPEYIYNETKRVNGKTNQEFVYVFKKFTVSENKVLILEMNELKGERNLMLEITEEIINNPN